MANSLRTVLSNGHFRYEFARLQNVTADEMVWQRDMSLLSQRLEHGSLLSFYDDHK